MNTDAKVKRYVLLVATSAAFLTPFMGSSVNVAIPSIGSDLGLGPLTLNWIVMSHLLATAVLLLPVGRAADLYGRKLFFQAGMALFAITSLLCGLARSGGALIAARTLQGLGSAMMFGTAMAIITSVFSPGERGRILGINVAAVYAGLSLGPVVGGFLTHHLGWRWLFYVNFLIGLPMVAIIRYGLRSEWRAEQAARYDYAGAILYGLGIGLSLYGIATVSTQVSGRWMLLGGIGCLAGFIVTELRRPDPLLNLGLFRNGVFAFSNLAALIHYSATFAIGYLLSLYLQWVKEFDARSAGLVLLSQPLLMTVVSPLAGRLSDRFEPRLIASGGMLLTFVGLLGFSMLKAATPLGWIIACLGLVGVGIGLFSSPNANAIMGSVDRDSYGVASAALGTARLVGQAFSMALATFCFALVLQGNSTEFSEPYQLLKAMRFSFGMFAALTLGGMFASLARGRLHTTGRATGTTTTATAAKTTVQHTAANRNAPHKRE